MIMHKDIEDYSRSLSIPAMQYSSRGDDLYLIYHAMVEDNPELFYMFVADLADRSDRHVCGLFLYDEKDSRRVNIYDILSREEKYREIAASKRNELGDYLRSLSRTQILDFVAFSTFRAHGINLIYEKWGTVPDTQGTEADQ